MTTQESTEKVLRQLYLLLARGEEYGDNPNKIIVDKNQAERLLNDLNRCVYDMLEQYEMTSRSREQAERAFKRLEEKMLADAQRRAEDVYAASIMYSEDSLNRISSIMRDASATMEKLYQDMSDKLQDEEKTVRRNQTELRSQLHALKDTNYYLERMKEWREEEEREKRLDQSMRSRETNLYANRRTEVKVDYDLLNRMNMKPIGADEEWKDESTAADPEHLIAEDAQNKEVAEITGKNNSGSEPEKEDVTTEDIFAEAADSISEDLRDSSALEIEELDDMQDGLASGEDKTNDASQNVTSGVGQPDDSEHKKKEIRKKNGNHRKKHL